VAKKLIGSGLYKNLYYVISYYQAFIAIVKVLCDNKTVADIVLSDAIPDHLQLAEKLRKSNVFNKVLEMEEKEYVYARRAKFRDVYSKLNPVSKFFMGKTLWISSQKDIVKYARTKMDIDVNDYQTVYVFGEGRSFAPYLYTKKKKFVLVEDALNYFQKRNSDDLIERNRMVRPRKLYWLNSLLDYLGFYYYMGGYSHVIEKIEVNENRSLVFSKRAKKKVIEVSRDQLHKKLTEENKKRIYNIFVDKFQDPIINGRMPYLVFTNPLLFDKLVKTEAQILDIYQIFIDEFCTEADVIYLKPHPRDNVDYSILKNHMLIILDKNMPSEVLGFNKKNHFKKALAISSTAIEQAPFAEDRINIGMSWLDTVAAHI
jgi:hypothetical protein